jgi:hypothetical protein
MTDRRWLEPLQMHQREAKVHLDAADWCAESLLVRTGSLYQIDYSVGDQMARILLAFWATL